MQTRQRRVPIYSERQMLQSKCITLSKITGVAIKATNTPAVSTNTMLYLITCAHDSDQWYSWIARKGAHNPTSLSLLLD